MKIIHFFLLSILTVCCACSIDFCVAQVNKTSARPVLRFTASFEKLNPDPMVIYFDQKNSAEFHKDYDALKLMNTDNTVPNLYVFSADGLRLSILGLPQQNLLTQTIPIGIKTEHAGVITFNTSAIGSMPYTYIYLKDLVAKTVQDLHQHPTITLQLAAGIYDHRFSLLFSNKAYTALTVTPDFNAYSANKKVYLTLDSISGLAGNFSIYSMNGQTVYNAAVSGAGKHIIIPGLTSAIYIIDFNSTTGVHSKKVYIGL